MGFFSAGVPIHRRKVQISDCFEGVLIKIAKHVAVVGFLGAKDLG